MTGAAREILTDIDMLPMIGIKTASGICHVISRQTKASNKYINHYNKNKEAPYLMYFDANNLSDGQCSQNQLDKKINWIRNLE